MSGPGWDPTPRVPPPDDLAVGCAGCAMVLACLAGVVLVIVAVAGIKAILG